MGGGTTAPVQSSTTSTAGATEEEKQMNAAQLAQFKAYEPYQTTMFKNAFTRGNELLTSFQQGSEQWNSLIGGITKQQTQSMINTQDKALQGSLQQSGIYDSGTAASGRLRAASDLNNQNAQFNVGTLQNALNLALTGQAQVQGTALGQSSQLGQSLAGLRSNVDVTKNRFSTVSLGILGNWGCWVAAEIFNGWYEPKTVAVRYYISHTAPIWFTKFYIKYGERIAKFIHNKLIFKLALRPLFECFALIGKKQMEGVLA